MHRSTTARVGRRAARTAIVGISTGVMLAGMGVTPGPVTAVAASTTVDADVVAGAQARPDVSYLANATAGCTHHVAENGSDTTPGTSPALAWRTVTKAMSAARPGQTVCVHAGRYEADRLTAARSGESAAPITIKAAPGEPRPVVVATSDKSLLDFQPGIGYWIIEGLDVTKNRTNGATVRVLGGHHIAIRNNVLRDGKSAAAVLLTNGATDVLVTGNDIHGHHRWENTAVPPAIEYVKVDGFRRADANAVNVEGSGVARVAIEKNLLHDNGGDGFQCIGQHDGTGPSSTDGADIDLVDNISYRNVEDAFDIKSCQRVSVRGSVAPTTAGSTATSKSSEYRPTDRDHDLPGNHSGGNAMVIHYYARNVLVEKNWFSDLCTGIAVGLSERSPVQNVVVRQNAFVNLAGRSSNVGDNKCAGRGVRLTHTSHVDIHDNTFDSVPAEALMVATDNGDSVSDDIDVWNNVINNAGTWIAVRRNSVESGGATNVMSDHNTFRHSDGSTNHFRLENNTVNFAAWKKAGYDANSLHVNP